MKQLKRYLKNKKINYFARKLINIFCFNKQKRRMYKYRLKEIIVENLKESVCTKYKDYYCFFSRNGLGDIYFTAGILHEFKKQNPGSKILYIVDKKRNIDFIKAFNVVDKIIFDSDYEILQGYALFQKKISKKQLNFIYFPYRGKEKNYVFADSYANLLNLPIDTKRKNPSLTLQNEQNASLEFKRLNINPKKTVLIVPEAVMFDYRVLAPAFWKTFADKLIETGYDVVFNSSNREYKKYKKTFLPIMDFVAFAKQVKYIYSFRSGITDLFAGMGIKNMTTIYPDNLNVIWTDKFLFNNLLNKYHEKLYHDEFDNIFHIYSLKSNFKEDFDEVFFNCREKDFIKLLIQKL